MEISPIKNNQTTYKGELHIKNIHSRLFAEDFKEILVLRKRISNEPFDITMNPDTFGRFNTNIKHENGNEVNIRRVALPNTIGAIPEYIEKIIDLVNINKVK